MKVDTLVIGAGPAGLTAALELQRAGCASVLVAEATGDIGGLSKTVRYRGNRIDIGGHRFFSKSDWVMNWWRELLPLEALAGGEELGAVQVSYRNRTREVVVPQAAPSGQPAPLDDNVMLLRNRLSRIYFGGRFFDYPLQPTLDTARKLGAGRCLLFLASYLRAKLQPRRPEVTLEDFFINRFGVALYRQFFKDYTEKVWGLSCREISADWGAQRVKGLSIARALSHALKSALGPLWPGARSGRAAQLTSLIERFLYPKFGPGQMWERAAELFRQGGGQVLMQHRAEAVQLQAGQVHRVGLRDQLSGQLIWVQARHVISTMPVKDLVAAMPADAVPAAVRDVAQALQYRDFITVGLLYERLQPSAAASAPNKLIADNWIYIQESGVRVGRLQIFNNWSPHMVADPSKVWLGMEYFCQEGDDLWRRSDADMLALGRAEMQRLGLAAQTDCLDGVVIRMPKAYPGYYGNAYARFGEIRRFMDTLDNLFLVGRNGMHRYNNQDHSMLTAKLAAQAIMSGQTDKSAIWQVNLDDDYHEEQRAS